MRRGSGLPGFSTLHHALRAAFAVTIICGVGFVVYRVAAGPVNFADAAIPATLALAMMLARL